MRNKVYEDNDWIIYRYIGREGFRRGLEITAKGSQKIIVRHRQARQTGTFDNRLLRRALIKMEKKDRDNETTYNPEDAD